VDRADYLIVLSAPDPVAQGVSARLGTGTPTGEHLDGASVRWVAPRVAAVQRSELHIFDAELDAKLPSSWRAAGVKVVFPSVHRSEQGHDALTVHPLGNLGGSAEVGGQPRTLVPSDPRRMTDALRRLAEGASAVGRPATYEATHHGPLLTVPAFFLEVGGGDPDHPPEIALDLLARVVREIVPDPTDHVVLGVGGGHYAPHFTDLALRRSLAFGHLLPRHALDELTTETAADARARTPDSEGVVYARAADAERPQSAGWGPRFRESNAARRGGDPILSPPSGDARSAGT
jgi:D-tyrosyl-tRNA(Tyr) deacylase